MSWSIRKSEDDKREFFDSAADLEAKVRHVADLLRKASHPIAFTGAGISTSVGIPDFRSGMDTAVPTGPGFWELKADFEAKQQHGAISPATPPPRIDLDKMLGVQPSFTHKALAKLVQLGYLKFLISQNVDGLHRRSGIPANQLAELHGNLTVEQCTTCKVEYQRDFRIGPNPREQKHLTGRYCDNPACGGALRDNLVPFGEGLPKSETDKAWRESDLADFCLAVGSSLTVTPACDYAGWVGQKSHAHYQRQYGNKSGKTEKGELVIVNLQSTPFDSVSAVRVNAFCDEFMEKLVKELGIEV